MLYKPYDLRVEDVKKPEIGPYEALIAVKVTGICGTDILTYKGLGPHTKFPIILGHEFSGVVAEVGIKSRNIQLDDRVIAGASWGCGHCALCKIGRSNFCENGAHVGRDVNGSFAQYIAIPSKKIAIIPENVSFEEAQSGTTIAGAAHAVKLGDVSIGDDVAVLGPGHAGLLISQVAKAAGASKVIVTGTRDKRLELAADLGADLTVNIKKESVTEVVKDFTDGLGVDIVIEATGRPSAVRQAIAMIKPNGTIVIFGIVAEAVDQFEMSKLYSKGLRMIGCRAPARGPSEYEKALKLISQKQIRVKQLITHIFPLEETKRALEVAHKRVEDAIRVIVRS